MGEGAAGGSARGQGKIYVVYADDRDAVAGGTAHADRRDEERQVSMADMARWKATLPDRARPTAVDLWRANREYLEERARWIVENDRR